MIGRQATQTSKEGSKSGGEVLKSQLMEHIRHPCMTPKNSTFGPRFSPSSRLEVVKFSIYLIGYTEVQNNTRIFILGPKQRILSLLLTLPLPG